MPTKNAWASALKPRLVPSADRKGAVPRVLPYYRHQLSVGLSALEWHVVWKGDHVYTSNSILLFAAGIGLVAGPCAGAGSTYQLSATSKAVQPG